MKNEISQLPSLESIIATMLSRILRPQGPVSVIANPLLRYNSTSAVRPADSKYNTDYDNFPPLEAIDAASLRVQKAGDGKAWYFVNRTRAGKLPVYRDYRKSDRNIHTVIRNVDGNHEQLRHDLKNTLGLDKKDIVMKSASKKVVIKLDCVKEVKSILGQHF